MAEPSPPAPAITYISWAESCSRSDHTARELGGRSFMVYRKRYGSRPSTILLKYAAQWRETSRIVRREHPQVVFVMTPPLVAAFPAFVYAWRHRGQVVLDAHSAAFLHPRWRRLQWLQRWLCRRAATTLVHNDHLRDHLQRFGAHATLVPDVPVIYETPDPFARPPGFTVAVVCSFNYDEPVAEIFAAATALPDVRFFVTGNPKHLAPALAGAVPPNVSLTGFISTDAYGGVLQGVDAVMTLTTRDHTMLRGAYEAIYQGTPVIVSDWELLRQAFPEGAVHVDNTTHGIMEGVRTMQADLPAFKAAAARLRAFKLERWTETRDAILARIQHETPASSTGVIQA